jgi:hypothetical protein
VSRRAAVTAAVLAGAGLIAGCGSQPAGGTGAGLPPLTAPLSTSLVTAQGTWAVASMGGRDADDRFWQLFFRPATSGRWSLVTPPGVADNGGLVAAAGGAYLVTGFRPSQNLAFSPLATSTDTGRNWTPGLLDAGLADTPGAIAVGPAGRTLALLQDGTIETVPTAGSAAAGRWAPLITLKALAASAPGRSCGLEGVTALSFGPDQNPMAAGSCARPGTAGVFTDAGGTWRALPPVPAGTEVLAPAGTGTLAPGTGGSYDALAVAGSRLTVWRLAHGAWAKVQQVTVPLQYGSSG